MPFITRVFLFSTIFSSPAWADSPDNGSVTIQSIDYFGEGCGQGSVGSYISSDNLALTLAFDEFSVDLFDAPLTQRIAKDCQVNVNLNVPQGWSYGLFCVDFRGFADLESSVVAEQNATYRFDSQASKDLGTIKLKGPFAGDYEQIAAVPVNTIAWSPCGESQSTRLAIQTGISLSKEKTTLDYRSGKKKALDLFVATNWIWVRMLGKRHAFKNDAKKIRDTAHDLYLGFVRRKPIDTLSAKFSSVMDGMPPIEQAINTENSLASDRLIKKAKEKYYPAIEHLGPMLNPVDEDAAGLITVDTIDGEMKQHYGLTWRRCSGGSGRWVQGDGRKRCSEVCRQSGMSPGVSPEGAACVSGEARPASATGAIDFVKGCWNSCASQGPVATQETRNYCYRPGQKKDYDRTDLTVGCFCK
jgi:hypothetical protein